jgi:hypothetical protein
MSFFFNGTGGIHLGARYSTGPLNFVVSYPFSISVWFFPTDLTSGVQRDIVHLEDNATSNSYWIDHLGSTLRVNTWNGTSVTSGQTITIRLNRWNHALARFVSNTSRFIQLNGGTPGSSATNSNQTSQRINALNIGQAENQTRLFQGYVAHVAIYNANLQNDYGVMLAGGANPLSVRPSNLIAYFPLHNPGQQRNLASAQSIAFNPLPIINGGSRYSNWNPPTTRFAQSRARKIILPHITNKLRSQIAFLKPYTGILPIANG